MWAWIAVLVVSVLVSVAMRPKTVTPTPGQAEMPVAEEGRPIRKIYGTVWINDPQVIGFKRIGTDRIRKKGGKK